MLLKNKFMIAFVMSVLFVTSCSNEMSNESSGENKDAEIYAEFVDSLESKDGCLLYTSPSPRDQ